MADPTRPAPPDASGVTASFADPALTTAPPPAATAPPTSTSPTERYVLGEEIARGGMGEVYRATDTVLGREVAVKVLQVKYGPDSAAARRFADEARITGQLQHPNIPAVHDLGILPDGRPFLAMKLIKGETLDERLKRRTDPSQDRGQFVAVFEAICQAMAYAHAHDVIHRDLKPANVMVGAFGEVQVMDWGLAKVLTSRDREGAELSDRDETAAGTVVQSLRDSDNQFTQAGSVLGTPAFMPPEQAVGAIGKVDARSDVFGLGAVLAVILTGQPPFAASSAETTRVKAAQGDVSDCFAELDASGADPELVALCKHCLSPKPADRPADAGEVAKTVAELRAAADERARQAELDRVKAEGDKAAAELQAKEQRKRRRVQAVLGMTLTALVVLGGLGLWWNDRVASERQREREVAEARVASEVRGLLDQAKLALGRDEIPPTDLALGQAEARLGDAGPEDLRAELGRLRIDREMLIRLRDIDDLRWMDPGSDIAPPQNPSGPQFADAIRWYGITLTPGTRPATVERINGSAIREQLVAALDAWLAAGADDPNGLAALLDTLDPDELRREYRTAMAARDFAKLREMIRRPDVTRLPPRFLTTVLPLINRLAPRADVLSVLATAWASNPGEFRIAYLIGNIGANHGIGNFESDIGYIRAAVAARPSNVTAVSTLGHFLLKSRRFPEAIQFLKRAVALDPSYPDPGYYLAQAYSLTGNREKADATIDATAARDPKPARAQMFRGILAYICGEQKLAIAHYRRTIELDPNWPQPHYLLALILDKPGDRDEAIREYRRVVELEPTWTPGYTYLIIAYESKGQIAEAITVCREGLKVNPTDSTFTSKLVTLHLRIRDLDGAEAVCRAAIKHDKSSSNWHSTLGNVLEQKGDFDGAIAAYTEARKFNPQLPPAFTQRAVRMKELLTRLPDILVGKAEPKTPTESFGFAQLCIRPAKRYAEAVRLFEKGFALNPRPAGGNFFNPNRYNAACTATLAARGEGIDAPTDPAERASLRAKALGWLKAELAYYRRRATFPKGGSLSQSVTQLENWLIDPDLSSLRPGFGRIGMPTDERTEWDKLWTEVKATLAEARKPAPQPVK